MGYNTDFDGEFKITPALSVEAIEELNTFCVTRHGGSITPDPGMPGFWCNWLFEDGGSHTVMKWNEQEKSYEMFSWARLLHERFFPEAEVHGYVRARGEDFDDLWSMQADGIRIYQKGSW